MSSEFAGRVAVVTGASSGIGRATARLLAAEGARVALFSRSEERLRDLAQIYPDQMLAVAGDVADEQAISRLFEECEKGFGPCDLLVNNAGMIFPRSLHQTSPEDWDRLFAVNVRGVFLATRRALPSMLERGSGAIVNVASISGVLGTKKFPGYVSYCASKAAVISLTEALAVELRDRGVRVNCISPGAVETQMWREAGGGAPASMTPEEVARGILFLLSSESSPMNGQNLHVYSS
ncbi:MAG TPA: SDR family oxidoreductase [Thermoanaerobaculia bacterium]|nr:SDR family oxidoreductase [Thermoanaerobaculia bacterium]